MYNSPLYLSSKNIGIKVKGTSRFVKALQSSGSAFKKYCRLDRYGEFLLLLHGLLLKRAVLIGRWIGLLFEPECFLLGSKTRTIEHFVPKCG